MIDKFIEFSPLKQKTPLFAFKKPEEKLLREGPNSLTSVSETLLHKIDSRKLDQSQTLRDNYEYEYNSPARDRVAEAELRAALFRMGGTPSAEFRRGVKGELSKMEALRVEELTPEEAVQLYTGCWEVQEDAAAYNTVVLSKDKYYIQNPGLGDLFLFNLMDTEKKIRKIRQDLAARFREALLLKAAEFYGVSPQGVLEPDTLVRVWTWQDRNYLDLFRVGGDGALLLIPASMLTNDRAVGHLVHSTLSVGQYSAAVVDTAAHLYGGECYRTLEDAVLAAESLLN